MPHETEHPPHWPIVYEKVVVMQDRSAHDCVAEGAAVVQPVVTWNRETHFKHSLVGNRKQCLLISEVVLAEHAS